jgi:hypothetical protein
VAKRAAIMVGRYTHAHQFKRARRQLKFLHTRLGRIIRISRKIEGNTALEDRFGPLLDLASRARHQEQRQRGPKVYSLHAPEVECIGRDKARAPCEFGCKVSIVTPATAPKGGQFVLHATARQSLRRSYTRSGHRRSRKAARKLQRLELSVPLDGLFDQPKASPEFHKSPRLEFPHSFPSQAAICATCETGGAWRPSNY